MISSTQPEFERSRLSKREDEILGYAIEGMTDIQIAQRLDISQSTVNSYWVRIRGKLGQLSRTELVALALKQKHREEMEGVLAQSHALEKRSTGREIDQGELQRSELYHAALEAMPEAILVSDERGVIVLANARLEAMFGYGTGKLVGCSVNVLIPDRLRSEPRRTINEYFADPHPVRLGSDRAIFARRQDRSEFRVMLLLDSRPTANGPITTCIVRDFVSEIDSRRQFVTAAASLTERN